MTCIQLVHECISVCIIKLCLLYVFMYWSMYTRSYIIPVYSFSSLVPRPSPAPVFDRSVFAYYKRSKTGAGEGLGTRL